MKSSFEKMGSIFPDLYLKYEKFLGKNWAAFSPDLCPKYEELLGKYWAAFFPDLDPKYEELLGKIGQHFPLTPIFF